MWIDAVGIILLIIVAGTAVGVWTWMKRSSDRSLRERHFREEMERLSYRKIEALERHDAYELAEIAGQEQALRERFLNGEEI